MQFSCSKMAKKVTNNQSSPWGNVHRIRKYQYVDISVYTLNIKGMMINYLGHVHNLLDKLLL